MGNGYVLESVNDVIQVYDTAGTPLLNGGRAKDLNTFYGYAPAIIRSGPGAGQRGPSITDPVCLYARAIGRFVHVVLTLDHVGTTATLSGNNHLDIAVSDTGNPLGTWTIYKLPSAEQRHAGNAGSSSQQWVLPRRLPPHRRGCECHLPDHERIRGFEAGASTAPRSTPSATTS